MRDGGADGRVPGSLDAQELLARLDAQVAGRLARALDQEAVLPLVHVLGLAHHPEQGLVDLERQGAPGPVAYVALRAHTRTHTSYEAVLFIFSETYYMYILYV